MPEVGLDGQEKLRSSSAVIVGAGGLGSPAAYYLAAAGVGRLGLVDFDFVDETNLHRQILHFQSDVGKSKTLSAEEKLRGINPFIQIIQHDEKLGSQNALGILAKYDVVIDGSDNFATRYLVNDACVLLDKPNVYGSIFRFEGQASVFWASRGPCYRCLFPQPPPPGEVPSCAETGVFGVLPGIVGCIQACEAIKIVLGVGEPLIGSLLFFESLPMQFRKLAVSKDPACPICGQNPNITKLIDYEDFCSMPEEYQAAEISVQDLKKKIDSGDKFTLVDVREQEELRISQLEGAVHIPMDDVEDRLNELDKGDEILVICRTGNRSGTITDMLRRRGYNAKNVRGGINAYSREVDPSLIVY